LRLTVPASLENCVPLLLCAGHRFLLDALTAQIKLRHTAISEDAFGPLTLAVYRLSGMEAPSDGIQKNA
jgi:hypothetical protein